MPALRWLCFFTDAAPSTSLPLMLTQFRSRSPTTIKKQNSKATAAAAAQKAQERQLRLRRRRRQRRHRQRRHNDLQLRWRSALTSLSSLSVLQSLSLRLSVCLCGGSEVFATLHDLICMCTRLNLYPRPTLLPTPSDPSPNIVNKQRQRQQRWLRCGGASRRFLVLNALSHSLSLTHTHAYLHVCLCVWVFFGSLSRSLAMFALLCKQVFLQHRCYCATASAAAAAAAAKPTVATHKEQQNKLFYLVLVKNCAGSWLLWMN